jgi:hypothetical protein
MGGCLTPIDAATDGTMRWIRVYAGLPWLQGLFLLPAEPSRPARRPNPFPPAAIEKLGMQYEGLHRQLIKRWGEFKDVKTYAMLQYDRSANPVGG